MLKGKFDTVKRLQDSDLDAEMKRKLCKVLNTVRVLDIREQAWELLFDLGNEQENINSYFIKTMLVELLATLPALERHGLISDYGISEYGKILLELNRFFDTLDCDDHRKIIAIEEIIDYCYTEEDRLKKVDEVYSTWVRDRNIDLKGGSSC